MFIKNILRKIYHRLFKRNKTLSGLRYWRKRAKLHGQRSVFNLQHPEEELAAVTQMQKDKLFPLLRQQLKGNEHQALDFGCGPGRFTNDLAETLQGKAIGVDPIKSLLDLAPHSSNVEYRLLKKGKIPLESETVDVVWICIVLGGITDDKLLRKSSAEIQRVLKKDGLVFLVENTSEQPNQHHWHYRSVAEYQRLFEFAELKHVSDYYDMDEKLSVLAGRKF